MKHPLPPFRSLVPRWGTLSDLTRTFMEYEAELSRRGENGTRLVERRRRRFSDAMADAMDELVSEHSENLPPRPEPISGKGPADRMGRAGSTRKRAMTDVSRTYARHLFHALYGRDFPAWMEAGWIRLAQWEAIEGLDRQSQDAAAKQYLLREITDELRFALHTVGSCIGIRTPVSLRRFHRGYSALSLTGFLTGKPVVNIRDLMDRSCGTACFFLLRQERSALEILRNPREILEDCSSQACLDSDAALMEKIP